MSEVDEILARRGIHDDGSTESDALESPEHRELFRGYVTKLQSAPDQTLQTRESCAHSWLQWLEDNDLNAHTVENTAIYRYADHLLSTSLSDSSIASRTDTVLVFHEWAASRGYIDGDNPFSGFELEEEYKNINRSLPKQIRILRDRNADTATNGKVAIPKRMVDKMLEHPGRPRLRNELILRLSYQTGVRTQELSNVRIEEDINREERSIRINSLKVPDDSDVARRTVYWQENTDILMWEWLDGGRRDAIYHGDEEDEGYLLRTRQSQQMRPSHISRIVKESAQRAGVNEVLYEDAAGKNRWLVTGHTLRHSFITYAANGDGVEGDDGMPLHFLREIAGHHKLDTTMGYISSDDDARKSAFETYGPR